MWALSWAVVTPPQTLPERIGVGFGIELGRREQRRFVPHHRHTVQVVVGFGNCLPAHKCGNVERRRRPGEMPNQSLGKPGRVLKTMPTTRRRKHHMF